MWKSRIRGRNQDKSRRKKSEGGVRATKVEKRRRRR
jgi:hypothetical protein